MVVPQVMTNQHRAIGAIRAGDQALSIVEIKRQRLLDKQMLTTIQSGHREWHVMFGRDTNRDRIDVWIGN
jgi:hypothetical protein